MRGKSRLKVSKGGFSRLTTRRHGQNGRQHLSPALKPRPSSRLRRNHSKHCLLSPDTGLRAGEALALTVDDLDFYHQTIRVNKSTDDRTREIANLKRGHLSRFFRCRPHWKPHCEIIYFIGTQTPAGILFATREWMRPRLQTTL